MNKYLYLSLTVLIISVHLYLFQCVHCSEIFDWWKYFLKFINLHFIPFLFNLMLVVHALMDNLEVHQNRIAVTLQ